VPQDVSGMVHDTDGHTPGRQVNAAGKWVVWGVESPEVSSSPALRVSHY
jgi:hypothetical protein